MVKHLSCAFALIAFILLISGLLSGNWIKDKFLASRTELSDFLAEVEKRAFKLALFAVRDNDVALDIVQDAMCKLAEKYGGKPSCEFPMLFHRILQNTIKDYYRRQKVRSRWTVLFSSLVSNDAEEDYDPLEVLETENQTTSTNPFHALQESQLVEIVEKELKKLPPRQREAFLLRYWEELDVAEAAVAMGCSEGSVKTHCSRATHTLAEALRIRGIEL